MISTHLRNRYPMRLLLIPLLAISAPSPATALKISNFRAGLACTNTDVREDTRGWICHVTEEILVTDQGRCRYNGEDRLCTWAGFEFDYRGAKPGIELECTTEQSRPTTFGNPAEEFARDSKRQEFTLPLEGSEGHFFNPQYFTFGIRPPSDEPLLSEGSCSFEGKEVFRYRFRTHFPSLPGGGDPAPKAVFSTDLWPGEGTPVLVAKGDSLGLKAAPSTSSKDISRVRTKPGERLSFVETRYVTTEGGLLRAREASVLEGRRFAGSGTISRDGYYASNVPAGRISVNPSQTLDYLQDRAEGTCFVRIEGVLLEASDCPANDPDRFELLREPVVEWWVRLDSPGAKGWLKVDDSSVRELEREF